MHGRPKNGFGELQLARQKMVLPLREGPTTGYFAGLQAINEAGRRHVHPRLSPLSNAHFQRSVRHGRPVGVTHAHAHSPGM